MTSDMPGICMNGGSVPIKICRRYLCNRTMMGVCHPEQARLDSCLNHLGCRDVKIEKPLRRGKCPFRRVFSTVVMGRIPH